LPHFLQDEVWTTILQSTLVLNILQTNENALFKADSLRPMLVAFCFDAWGAFLAVS